MFENARILFTGVTSIHGWPFYQKLRELLPAGNLAGIRPPKMTVPDDGMTVPLCVTDREGLEEVRKKFKPTHVVSCSGVCDLDVCEERPEWAYRINTIGARNIAGVFGRDSHVLYVSSDLVYSGEGAPAGGYTEEHEPDPIHVAGKTIAGGEKEIALCGRYAVVRLGLPLGSSITGGKGAFDWVRSRFIRGLPVTLFTDEHRSAIKCSELTSVLLRALQHEWEGLYHLGGQKPVSLYDIGKMVLDEGNFPPHLLTGVLRSEEKDGPPRIGNVALNSSKIKYMMASSTGSAI